MSFLGLLKKGMEGVVLFCFVGGETAFFFKQTVCTSNLSSFQGLYAL